MFEYILYDIMYDFTVFDFILYLLLSLILLYIDYRIADEFYQAAQAKGFSSKKYFWITFLLGFIGYLLVIALPDRGNTVKAVSDELPDL